MTLGTSSAIVASLCYKPLEIGFKESQFDKKKTLFSLGYLYYSITLIVKNFSTPSKVSYFPIFGSLIPNPTIIFLIRVPVFAVLPI